LSNRFADNPFLRAHEPLPSVESTARVTSASMMALDKIIQAKDLSVVFQPIVRVDGGEVFAYEALVRCAVPEYKNPMKLFERAVRERCVGRLGKTIREVAVPLCAGVPVFLNVHPVELEDRWLVRPDDAIYSHDEPVYLEITEAVPLEHFDLCRSVLREIQERADARLVVDDLGAGYSNLKYIADLEPAVVKLDRELVASIDQQPRVQRLVRWLVLLCEDLGADVVAEGVETEAELSCVRDQGVKLVQGYFLARPGFPLPLADRVARDARGRARRSPLGASEAVPRSRGTPETVPRRSLPTAPATPDGGPRRR
jgi:EAL domain-containing protein (putative c-di-GMP-specific phosphodiesterase class I)